MDVWWYQPLEASAHQLSFTQWVVGMIPMFATMSWLVLLSVMVML